MNEQCNTCKQVYDIYVQTEMLVIVSELSPHSLYVDVAHSMLIDIYHILKDNIPFVDLGSEYYNQFNKERKINVYLKKLKALGWESDTAAVSLPA